LRIDPGPAPDPDDGVSHILILVAADLKHIDRETFWLVMDAYNGIHAFDVAGGRLSRKKLPRSINQLVDDPNRSLADELRHLGQLPAPPDRAKQIKKFSGCAEKR
jgi:hypothetical protein